MQFNLNTINNKKTRCQSRTANSEELLNQALADLEQFLIDNPHLQSYQEEIDRILDNSGNSQGRMAVLGTLMQGKLLEMQNELCKVTRIFCDVVGS